MLHTCIIIGLKLITFSTCIHFLGLIEENETEFMSVGMSCGEKSVPGWYWCNPGEKNDSATLGSSEEGMKMFLYQWEVE